MDATVKQINFAKDICVLTKDLISRVDATSIPVLPKEHREYQTFNLDDAYEQGWYDLQKCIETLPSAEPKTGKWVLDPNGMDWNIPAWRCSECGFVANYIGVEVKGIGNNPMNWAGSKFCPNCGAVMKGGEDE